MQFEAGEISLDQFKKQALGASKSLSGLATTLLSIGANMAIMAAISAVVYGIGKAWDYVNVTVAEEEQKISELTSAYQGLKSEYDQLSEKQELTAAEEERLKYLERRLELDEQIIEAEQHKLFQEKTGNGLTDRFDKDNLNTQYRKEVNRRGTGYNSLKDNYELQAKALADVRDRMASIKSLQEDIGQSDKSTYDYLQAEFDSLVDSETNLVGSLSAYESDMTINLGTYIDNIEWLQEQIDSGSLTADEKKIAEEQLSAWQELYDNTENMLIGIQRLNGTYTLTPSESLANRNGQIANGDINQIEILRDYTKGFNEEQIMAWNKITKGCDNAYIAIKKYEESLKSVAQETSQIEALSISETVDSITNKLSPALTALNTAYSSAINDKDITSAITSLKSALDTLNSDDSLNIDIDYSAYEDYVKVLTDSKSTIEEIEKAHDKMATSLVNSMTDGTENAEVFVQALQDLGVKKIAVFGDDGTIKNLELEKLTAEQATQALLTYQLAKQLANTTTITTQADCANILAMAQAAGIGGQALDDLNQLMSMIETRASMVSAGQSTYWLDQEIERFSQKTMMHLQTALDGVQLDWGSFGNSQSSGSSSASSAGKDAADAYLEAFEKELEELQGLRDNGIISEKEYLDRLRALYNKYFRDRKEYLKEFAKYEKEYLEGMKSLYEQAFSYIISQYDKKIDALNTAKEAAVSALEAERDAAVDAIDDQIDALKAQQDAIDDEIDKLNDEIDAIKEANAERERQMTLMQAQYELERALNQRTKLVKRYCQSA